MRLLFLIPLTIGLGAGYISQRTTEDIAYLTGAVTVIGLFFGLILAPWQLQLFFLLFAIVSIGFSWRQLANKREVEGNDEDNPDDRAIAQDRDDDDTTAEGSAAIATARRRKYRGVCYEPTAPICQVSQGAIAGKYRGTPWRLHTLKQIVIHQTRGALKYRGIPLSPPEEASEDSRSSTALRYDK